MWHACDSHVTHMWLLKKFQPQTIYRHSRNKWSVLVWLWKRNKREASQYANEWKNCRGTHNSFQLPVVVQKCTQFWCQSHLSLQVSCSCMAVKLFLQIANSVNRNVHKHAHSWRRVTSMVCAHNVRGHMEYSAVQHEFTLTCLTAASPFLVKVF